MKKVNALLNLLMYSALLVCCFSCSRYEGYPDISDYDTTAPTGIYEYREDELSGDNILFSDIQEYFRLEPVKAGDSYEYVCNDGHVIVGKCVTQADYMLDEYLQRLDFIRVEFAGEAPREQFRLYAYNKNGEKIILFFARHAFYVSDSEGKHLAEFTFGDRAIDIELMMAILFRPEQLSEYVAHFDDYTYISGYNQVLKTWNGYCLDTDGDGENENIFLAFCGEPWHDEWSFYNPHTESGEYVTGVHIYVNGRLCIENKYSFAPRTSHLGLVRLPGDDEYMYLTTYESGGDLCETNFYRLENNFAEFAFGSSEDIFTYSMVSYEHGGLPVITGINEAVLEKISH